MLNLGLKNNLLTPPHQWSFLNVKVFINKLKYYEKNSKINRKRFISYR
jgi:hypothetical protein